VVGSGSVADPVYPGLHAKSGTVRLGRRLTIEPTMQLTAVVPSTRPSKIGEYLGFREDFVHDRPPKPPEGPNPPR
jgi:hypothetical protein